MSEYKSTGTTSPQPIPPLGEPIEVGKHYFALQIRAAQAAFAGRLWERAKRLLVTSRVSLNHPELGNEPVQALHRSREVQKGRAEQLGLAPNLIRLIPATMTHVSVSIEFILDKENRLAQLAGLINDDSFLTALSLAPGAAVVAKTVGGLAQKLLHTFFQAEEREPILQFAGDFNLNANNDNALRAGYYAILGTRDENNPLPRPLPRLSVQNGDLLADDKPITQWSYVLLQVHRVEAHTRDEGVGRPWYQKLAEAEGIAQDVENDPFIEEATRKERWQTCQKLLSEARTLLMADPEYLAEEAKNIIRAATNACREQILGDPDRVVMRGATAIVDPLVRWNDALRELLDVESEDDLRRAVNAYAEQVYRSRQIIRQTGL
jgi:hypothetical protein